MTTRAKLGAALFVALLAAGITTRVLWVRRILVRETQTQLARSLDFTRPAVALWRDGYVAQATLAARLPDPRSAVEALRAGQGVLGAWTYDSTGRVSAGPAPAPAPPTAFADSAIIRTGVERGVTYADIVTRLAHHAGSLTLRVAVPDTTLASFNPARGDNPGLRTTLLARIGDSVRVIATATSGRDSVRVGTLALATAPPHLREAFAGQASRGIGRDIAGRDVIYAATPVAPADWVLVREQQLDVLFGLIRVPLWIEETVLVILATLIATVVVVLVRSARAKRETTIAQLRADFVSAVSHELRTPLAQIRLFAELLRKNALQGPEEADRAIGIIEKEAGRLSILVDNILSYTSLRRRARFVTPLAADVAAEARQVIDSFAPLAAERGAQVVADLEENTRARIDTQALRQVLLNFLENAVKYGPRGQTVTVGARHAGPRVRLWVDDQGPGVPSPERTRVWDAFYRSDSAQRAGVGGSGLGLSVVRDLVAQYGGAVAVEEAPAGGARFVAELPGF